ncbi:helix-turn-helix transcriptional regulator [Streptomyces sp. HPF1205]|uniref:helix-turn-helix domain-containing protein n=1 Tax=Streptomyces sp. HPF1205 TaxID=2873262 RepID=UPI001CECB26B|nr:helix-turn-helix transcriptional regulator [Streptomyces sp. HPF1205]
MAEERDGTGAGPQETLASFCDDLLQLRKDADLTLRELEKLSGYSKSALSKATSGTSLPSLELTEAYVGACKAPDPEAWRARWHRLAARLRTNPAPRPPVPGAATPAAAAAGAAAGTATGAAAAAGAAGASPGGEEDPVSASPTVRPVVKIAAAPLVLATALIATLILVSSHRGGSGELSQPPTGTPPTGRSTASAAPPDNPVSGTPPSPTPSATTATPRTSPAPQSRASDYTAVYTGRTRSLRDYNEYFDLLTGTVVGREGAWTMSTNAGGDSHGAFELQPMTDAYLAGRIVPTADQCAAGLARHATNRVRFPQAPPGTSFCLRDRPTGDIVVVQVIDLDYGNWAATVTLTRYRRTSPAPGSTL